MQARDRVLVRREAHREDRHREELPALLADLTPQVEELVEREAQVSDVAPEVLPEHLGGEDVDAGRHRRVGREDVAGRGHLARLREGEALLLDEVPDLLERHEGRVALVDVPDRRDEPDLVERARAADAQHDLLLQAQLVPAAVEPLRDLAIRRLVLRQVRVEQQERHTADPREADQELHRPSRQLDRHDRRGPVGGLRDGQGQLVRIQDRIRLGLAALGVQDLAEVAFAVEESDPGHRHAHVRGGLQQVPGQHAEASGVDREHLGQAEFRREVGDLLAVRQQLARPRVPGLGEVLLRETPHQRQQLALIGRVLGRAPEPVGRHLPEELDRIAADALPRLGVQELEKRPHLGPPGPAQVVGQGEEREELFGYPRDSQSLFEDGRQLDS